MRFIKKFEKFLESAMEPMTKPSRETKPSISPEVMPGRPKQKPEEKPQRPSPIKRERPSVEPDPKAKLKKASAEEVAEKFIELMVQNHEDVKKYTKIV
jgi:hypothetical protein